MNLIQTLYIDNNKDCFHDSFGWASPEYHLMGWALSSLQLEKIYGKIKLYANLHACRLLNDILQLPYTEVRLQHDKLLLIHPEIWALPKIYTYSLQEKPFLHIDGDVFIFKPLPTDLLKGRLIVQNIEVATEEHYSSIQKQLIQYFSFFPPSVEKDFSSGLPILSCNAGILGGSNISFFQEYTALAFEYVQKNANNLKHINVNSFNVFFEQHLFYSLAKEKGIPVNALIEGIIEDKAYKNMGDFHDVPFNRSYLHLLGEFKKDEYTCIQMAAKLRELYPNYYERIVKLFHKKNIKLSPCGFSNPFSKHIEDVQHNTHLQRLKQIIGLYPVEIEIELFQKEFENFYKQLVSFFSTTKISIESLSKRDLESQHWYHDLFAKPSDIIEQVIVRCSEIEIFESSFDWGGLFNRFYRIGTEYYSDVQIKQGQFYNLIVFEGTDNGFSLYDINELDNALLLVLTEPHSIREIINEMQIFFDDDVINNHYNAFLHLILDSIKQLVIKKTIRPFAYDK